MQINAIQRNFTKMPAISRRFTKTPANSRKFLHDRGIAVADCASHCVNETYIAGYAPSFPFRGGRQAGLGACRQGIEVKRLAHRRSLPRRPAFREELVGNVNRRRGGGRQSTALIVTLAISLVAGDVMLPIGGVPKATRLRPMANHHATGEWAVARFSGRGFTQRREAAKAQKRESKRVE